MAEGKRDLLLPYIPWCCLDFFFFFKPCACTTSRKKKIRQINN